MFRKGRIERCIVKYKDGKTKNPGSLHEDRRVYQTSFHLVRGNRYLHIDEAVWLWIQERKDRIDGIEFTCWRETLYVSLEDLPKLAQWVEPPLVDYPAWLILPGVLRNKGGHKDVQSARAVPAYSGA
jgi:hypothetical protein